MDQIDILLKLMQGARFEDIVFRTHIPKSQMITTELKFTPSFIYQFFSNNWKIKMDKRNDKIYLLKGKKQIMYWNSMDIIDYGNLVQIINHLALIN